MKNKTNPSVQIKQMEDNPIPTEVIADSIIAISDGIRKLRAGRLNDNALFLLIQHAAPNPHSGRFGSPRSLSIKDIRAVINGIESLEKTYLKKKD